MEFNIVKPTKEQLEAAAQATRPELEAILANIAADIMDVSGELAGMHGDGGRNTAMRERVERRLATDIRRMAYLYIRISKILMKKPIDKPKLTKYDNEQYIREHGAT